jgi:DNA primase
VKTGGKPRSDAVETVRSRADLREVVSEYVPLKKSGSRYRANCPFHEEKTPSFYVDADKQLFYCFGCGAGGDVFKFLMLHEKWEFPEALRSLARRYGVTLPIYAGSGGGERQKVLLVNRRALEYFRERLQRPCGENARKYLISRGIRPETIEMFMIGYAPEGWQGLKDHLAQVLRREVEAQGLTSGLLARKPETGRTYDRFRDRVMFPILSLADEIIGFGGRVIGAGEPKYLNSPETPAFSKGEQLYGLVLARDAIRRRGHVVLVEGYMDVIALHQAGVGEAVATLGTGFTPGHVRLLKRFTDRAIVNFDPDAAGRAAARRSLEILLESGFEVHVVSLPPGQDPDLYIREHGVDAYRARLEEARPYIEFVAREAASRVDLATSKGKVEALNEVLPFLARLDNPVKRAGHVEEIAAVLGIEDRLILQELKEAVRERRKKLNSSAVAPAIAARPVSEAESRLVRALMDSEPTRALVLGEIEDGDIERSRVAEIIRAIRRLVKEDRDVTYPVLGAEIGDPARDILTRIAATPHPPATPEEGRACLMALRTTRLQRLMRDIQRQLESEGDGAEVDRLLRRKIQLKRSIETLGDAIA